jgi:hypothetical protein
MTTIRVKEISSKDRPRGLPKNSAATPAMSTAAAEAVRAKFAPAEILTLERACRGDPQPPPPPPPSAFPVVIRLRIEQRVGRANVFFNDELLAVGNGAVVCQAARKLMKRGYHPASRLEAWRGDMLCLVGPVGRFAELTVEDGPAGALRFRLYRPPRRGPPAGRAIVAAEAAE